MKTSYKCKLKDFVVACFVEDLDQGGFIKKLYEK